VKSTAATPKVNSYASLIEAKKLADKMGGVENARAALDVLAKLLWVGHSKYDSLLQDLRTRGIQVEGAACGGTRRQLGPDSAIKPLGSRLR